MVSLWRASGLLTLVICVHLSGSIYWPAGSYGIPKAASGCPDADGFQWLIGRRYQDTEDNNPDNRKSPGFHLDATVDNKRGIMRSFCMKIDTSTDTKRGSWPPGKYCIYKKGGSCPTNLTSGFIKWDDEDNYNNENNKTGTLPDGVYDYNTMIEFCCRTDGDKNDPISLPSLKPFFLLAYDSAECQQVMWAVVSVEWIRFDNEDNGNSDDKGGSYPHGAGIDDHKIHYCYYQGCNEILTGLNGTFQSPNYPRKYPDGQYCSWRITVSLAQQIHLTFTNFSLQNENNTDTLYVYDGENVTGEVLGVFYGGHPPRNEGINSSSNHLFIIFKSDKNDSYTGFSASYNAVNCSACKSTPTASTSSSRSRKHTPSPSVLPSPSRWSAMTSPSYTEPVITSSITEPSLMTTSYKEPEMTSSPKEPEMTSSFTEPEMTSSYSLPEMTSSFTEPQMTSSSKEPDMTSSYSMSEMTSSFTEPQMTSSYTEPSTTIEPTEPSNEGINVAAVVVPLVLLVLLAVCLAAGFLYYKRRKAKENDAEPKEIIHMSEPPLSLDNPCYSSEEASNYHNDVKAPEKNEMEPKLERENDKPLYESVA